MSSYFSPSCREYLGGWIKLKGETPTEENVCEFCAADNEECGEYPDLCYLALREEMGIITALIEEMRKKDDSTLPI